MPKPDVRAFARAMLLCYFLSGCTSGSSLPAGSRPPSVVPHENVLQIGTVLIRGVGAGTLTRQPTGAYTNGTDTFYVSRLSDGGELVLHRFQPTTPFVTSNPYPQIDLPGQSIIFSSTSHDSPFFKLVPVTPPYVFDTPYRQMKWPAVLTDAGVGIVFVAESPLFEEAIEPFVSAYPAISLATGAANRLGLQFATGSKPPELQTLVWKPIERTTSTTTYVAPVPGSDAKAIELHLSNPRSAKRVWYLANGHWRKALTDYGTSADPSLLLVHTDHPTELLIESSTEAPSKAATLFLGDVGYVQRARWSSFAIYGRAEGQSFFDRSMVPAFAAYDQMRFALRDEAAAPTYSQSWQSLLKSTAFTPGSNLLNPKFFDKGLSEAADPSFGLDPSLQVSVSWVTDEAALQAAMGQRLFGFPIDPRYGDGVRSFYDSSAAFYWGAYLRSQHRFTSADTGGQGVVIGYNYLLSLTRLTELIGTGEGLPAADVQSLLDRVLPILQPGYISGYSQLPYLWKYPSLSGLQWESGMGKRLSEAQLSYVCGLWWLKTHLERYRDCQVRALQLADSIALRIRGSSFLWGPDVVHGSYVLDALLLAYSTTGDDSYREDAVGAWRYELMFLFANANYPETSFDDRAMAVTSFYSTFANLSRGNYWRGDEWNNSRTLWSLAKTLAFVDDPSIVWLLEMASQTHKESFPIVDAPNNPGQRSNYYAAALDPKDLALGWEDLSGHYSTQIAYSTDLWREAFIFESIESEDARVYRLPGVTLDDAGMAYVVGQPGASATLQIDAHDCAFAGGARTMQVRLNANGTARVPLIRAES
jgi:hypothetical protein